MRARVPTPRAQEPKQLPNAEARSYPKPYKVRNFYTPKDVAVHNVYNDCWVSLFNKVYDLTKLIHDNHTESECDPIVLAAGTDITHWFDPATLAPKTHIDPKTGTKTFLCPTGRFLHVPPTEPHADWDSSNFSCPWWENDLYVLGELTRYVRKIRIINTLTRHDDVLDCATEETINEILDRYLAINTHAASYTWKRLGKVLDMSKTLDDNGICDDTQELQKLGMPVDEYIQGIHLYYNDDLTIA